MFVSGNRPLNGIFFESNEVENYISNMCNQKK